MNQPSPEFFAQTLLHWYDRHKRPLPWRTTTDPYAIWLSEVILQQTRVAQGLPYYERFLAAYPTVQALAAAPEDEVLRHWQGLGYYSRARNMHHTARHIATTLNGIFPATFAELLRLKGVGEYTAAAVASFAFREPVPVLDGNVFRVLARVFGVADDIASPAGKKIFRQLASRLIPQHTPHTYNQAIMEFGAIQCTPVSPDCLFCPLQQACSAFHRGMVQQLPVKKKAKAARQRHFHYLVLEHNGCYYLRKRPGQDIWQGLYDFHLLETPEKNLQIAENGTETPLSQLTRVAQKLPQPGREYRHVLSHQKISAKFYLIRLNEPLGEDATANTGLTLFSKTEIEQLPKPVLISNYLKDAGILVSL